jgi:hypothetical protein
MKAQTLISSVLCAVLLSACRLGTPEPITVLTTSDFTLSTGQTAEISDASITVTLIAVSGDSRCPLGMECAVSGPVSVSLSIRDQSGMETTENLQTFTDVTGLAPEMEFQGIKDRTTVDGYSIKIVSVLPYPASNSFSIGEPDYQVTLQVTKE